MSEQHEFVIWRTEGDYDALEPFLSGARVNYKRSKLTQFSVDPTHATIITVTCVAIRSLALVLTAYINERRRRIVVARPYGTKLAADNYSADEVESAEHKPPTRR